METKILCPSSMPLFYISRQFSRKNRGIHDGGCHKDEDRNADADEDLNDHDGLLRMVAISEYFS